MASPTSYVHLDDDNVESTVLSTLNGSQFSSRGIRARKGMLLYAAEVVVYDISTLSNK
jgi:hypothetical protein